MRKTSFIDCTSYFGSFTGVTGSIRGIYDFNSGSASGIIYNLIYPTGSHFQSGNIYSPIIPLISVGKNTISGYTFTGVNNYRFGYTQSGDFAILADMEYSGCSKTTTGVGNVFISTADSPTGISGTFFIGINDANRLFFGTSGQYNQLDYELKTHNLVYVSMAGQKHVNYGIFDYLNQTYKGNSVTLTNNQSLVNKIYIGGFLNNTDTNYTGFFGKVNDAVFFDQHIPLDDISSCSNCLFVTGQSGTANVGNYTVPAITGYVLSGISGQIVTGSILVTGQVFNYSGGLINVVFDSDLLTKEEQLAGFKVISIKESECYLWKEKGAETWLPLKGFCTALRVFEPYKGVLVGIEPKLIKNVLYIRGRVEQLRHP